MTIHTDTDLSITIATPNEMHVHFRDKNMMKTVVPYTARQFGRGVVMPNTPTPITTAQQAELYREEIKKCLVNSTDFTPLMMAYLTPMTNPEDIAEGFERGIFFGAKLYPSGATTNSNHGIHNIKQIASVLHTMETIGMPLSIHGEVVDSHVDIFDREKHFLHSTLTEIINTYPKLRITMEHITTKDAVEFLHQTDDTVGATITPQHLMYNRNAMLVGGIRPHLYCLPILKREENRLALRELITSGFNRVFLGTDSAPHTQATKESNCGCAGVFSAMHALEFYAHVFDEENALHHFEGFATTNAEKFHNMPNNAGFITLEKKPTNVPASVQIHDTTQTLIPLCAGETIQWKMQEK